jgi:ABC-2 type transport system ATP-binding protein
MLSTSTARVQSTKATSAFISTEVATLKHIYKSYGSIHALQDVNLHIRAGEVLALLGPNGAGKTTAVHLLLGLIRPTKGEVKLFGGDPQSLASRSRLGTMLQISGVPETLKVKEHLELYRSYYPNSLSTKELLETTGLLGLEDRLYAKLSGGQKQRLHLALAMCGNPDLLFLDEPTTGLDVASRRGLWEQIRTLKGQGRTIVLTTHYLEEADALADRVVVLHHGRIIANGTPSEIKSKTSGRKIRVVTRLEPAWIERLQGVTSVKRDGGVLEILSSNAEGVVRELLAHDPTLTDLEVSSAGLEDAFLALTQTPSRLEYISS